MVIWKILQTFGIFYGHIADLAEIWYIFSHFGISYQGKSGNPVPMSNNQVADHQNVEKQMKMLNNLTQVPTSSVRR
jgi:hypothetical protein